MLHPRRKVSLRPRSLEMPARLRGVWQVSYPKRLGCRNPLCRLHWRQAELYGSYIGDSEPFYKVRIPIYLQYFGIPLAKRRFADMGQNFFIYFVYNPLSGNLRLENCANKLWWFEEKSITFAAHIGNNYKKLKMQQNRMNILATTLDRGTKCFEGMLYTTISCIEPAASIGETIQLKRMRTRIL